MPLPQAPTAQTPFNGTETWRGSQNGKPALLTPSMMPAGAQGPKGDPGAASTVAGPKGDPGAKGDPGIPKRIERYSGAAGAQVTFTPAFAAPPIVHPEDTWVSPVPATGPQMIAGTASKVTATGFTVGAVVRSRGTLLLTGSPFEAAPTETVATFLVFGS